MYFFKGYHRGSGMARNYTSHCPGHFQLHIHNGREFRISYKGKFSLFFCTFTRPFMKMNILSESCLLKILLLISVLRILHLGNLMFYCNNRLCSIDLNCIHLLGNLCVFWNGKIFCNSRTVSLREKNIFLVLGFLFRDILG